VGGEAPLVLEPLRELDGMTPRGSRFVAQYEGVRAQLFGPAAEPVGAPEDKWLDRARSTA
jgi:hypothetical protein